jgi:branched-chain amino acid transport system substrate-binding protein
MKMKQSQPGSRVISAVMTMLFFMAFSLWAHAVEREPMKVGVVCGMTGFGYSYTDPFLKGVKLAVDEINKSGGVLGRPLELITRDDDLKVDIGVREMRYLIMKADVDVVVGGFGSHIALAQSEIAESSKIPFIVCLANSHTITEAKGHRYVFQLPPSTRMEGNAVAEYIAALPVKKIWTVGPDYEFGRTLVSIPVEKLKRLRPDIEIVGQSWPKMGEKEMAPYITQILSGKPDLVYNVQWGGDMVSFIKQAKPYGLFQKIPFAGLFDQPLLSALGDEMVEGVIGFSRGDFFAVKKPTMNDFVDKYMAAFPKQYPTAYSVFGYEAIRVYAQAAGKVGGTNKEHVIDTLSGMRFQSPRGDIYFREFDHIASGSVYVGKTYKDRAYPFFVYKDIVEVPADRTWLPVEEVKRLRAK